MRHGNSGRRLNRNSSHRHAMWGNMVTALVTNGRIETTLAKAKELRKHADDAIGWGISVVGLMESNKAEDKAKVVHAKRSVRDVVRSREAMDRLFGDVAKHFATRKGGYTRVLKSRIRRGDAAPMALVELVGLAAKPAAADVAAE